MERRSSFAPTKTPRSFVPCAWKGPYRYKSSVKGCPLWGRRRKSFSTAPDQGGELRRSGGKIHCPGAQERQSARRRRECMEGRRVSRRSVESFGTIAILKGNLAPRQVPFFRVRQAWRAAP